MFQTLKNAFKIKEIRLKILFTFAMLVVIRIGSQLPVPGIKAGVFEEWFKQQMSDSGDAFNFFNAFTGGSFLNMSVFALNITPYITSSIIMQLLTIAIPKLEEMQKEGDDGRKKIASITRYVTIGLSLVESIAMVIGFRGNGVIDRNSGFLVAFTCVMALTAGSAFLMWIGESITEHGIGNGISIVLVINIISRIPNDLQVLFTTFVSTKFKEGHILPAVLAAIIIVAIILGMIVLVVILNAATRRISVQYAQKMQGRRLAGGASSSIPLKVNTAGVIPIIFASSIMQFPVIICSLLGVQGKGFWGGVLRGLSSSNWCNPKQPIYSIGLLVYIVLVIFFAYFYTSITFNPLEVANNLKKQGGFIPGIRPGKPTVDYLNKILNYIIFIGAVGLTIICIIPFFFNGIFGASVTFGGTSLIIIVSVLLETMKQIESQMLVRNYKGFLND